MSKKFLSKSGLETLIRKIVSEYVSISDFDENIDVLNDTLVNLMTDINDKATKEYVNSTVDELRDEHIDDIQNLQNDMQNLQNGIKDHKHSLSNITDFFMGSYKEYETAYAAGSIPVGALVIITDDNESDDATSPILGTGKLDSMILG